MIDAGSPGRRIRELDLIRWIRSQVGESPLVPIGIGDDCAAITPTPGQVILATCDMVIEGVHYAADRATPRQVGHKAMARGLSDIAAMAGDALAVLVAMAAPKDTSLSWFQEMFRGMKEVADAFNVRIIGGDISSCSGPLTLTITALGVGEEAALVRRSGARVGDMLMVTGELGGSILGRHLTFMPRLMEARWLRERVRLGGMIDVSDGLAADAMHLAEESQVGIEIWEEAIPISAAARKLAEASGRTPLEHALHDGEDYELLFTLAAREAESLLGRSDLPVKISCVGEVVAGGGLWIRRRGELPRPLEPAGWVHEF